MNDKIGRNELCPCGSGKKHKKCCLATALPYIHAPYIEVTDDEWHQLRRLEGKLVDDHLTPYAIKELPKEVMALAMSDLIRDDFPQEMKTEVLFHNFILPYFLFNWISGDDLDIPDFNPEITIAENYVNVHGNRLNQRERRFLASMGQTYYSFYSILEVELDRSLTVKDIFLGTTHSIKERQGTHHLKRGDIVYSRLLTLDHQSIFIGMAPFVLPLGAHADLIDFKQWLIEETEEEGLTAKTLRDDVELDVMDYFFDALVEAFNKPLPTLCNTDGDLFQFCTSHFELNISPESALEALLPLTLSNDAESILEDAKRDKKGKIKSLSLSWLRKGNKQHKDWENTSLGNIILTPGKLTLETNSEKRASKGRKLIEKALGKIVNFQKLTIEAPDSKMKSAPKITKKEEEKQEAFMASPEVQAELKKMVQAHWKAWFDQPIPMLDDQTPRQAAKTEMGKERLEALLLYYERSDAERDEHDPLKADIQYLRRELALEES